MGFCDSSISAFFCFIDSSGGKQILILYEFDFLSSFSMICLLDLFRSKSFLWVSCQIFFGSWSENRGRSYLRNILRWPSFWSLSDLRSNLSCFLDLCLRIDTAPIWDLKLRLPLLNWMSVWIRRRSYLQDVPVSYFLPSLAVSNIFLLSDHMTYEQTCWSLAITDIHLLSLTFPDFLQQSSTISDYDYLWITLTISYNLWLHLSICI